jgi:N6-L-threonylcarbamoyladenine synthase
MVGRAQPETGGAACRPEREDTLDKVEQDIYILGIESSCDETAAAVVKNGREVLSNIISSQIVIHRKFGGVVPEIASRKHIEHIIPVIHEALKRAGVTLKQIDGIAVTYGPGLVGALLVGLAAAKALAWALDKPLLGVNHLEGHVFANFINDPSLEPPFLALVVSGGHTSLMKVTGYNSFELLGQTRDDAAGEAFDKIARVMGLPYPGGPEIEKLALEGNPQAIDFPRAMLDDEPLAFSFSGMKSSVINYLHNEEQGGRAVKKADVAASFQEAMTDVLVQKTILALKSTGLKEVVLAGGVSANKYLQHKLALAAEQAGARLVHPRPILCTDNAVMIACRGYYMFLNHSYSALTLNADPALKLG